MEHYASIAHDTKIALAAHMDSNFFYVIVQEKYGMRQEPLLEKSS